MHKLSKTIIDENQVIAMEDLNINGMLKNHKLARSISDAGWGLFKKMLEYKSLWYGRIFYETPKFYPSSKLCFCGYINNNLKLSDREWTCPVCHRHYDRDSPASDMILLNITQTVGQELSKRYKIMPMEIGSMDDIVGENLCTKKHPIGEAGRHLT